MILAHLTAPLRDAGYNVAATTSFDEARQQLATRPPNLLIAASRLGGFNGLHLVMCGCVNRPGMSAIVTTPATDPVLEVEASAFGAACVVAPENRAEVLAAVSRAFASRPM